MKFCSLCFSVLFFCHAAHSSFLEDWSAPPSWPEPISFAAGSAATLTALALRHPLGDNFQTYESTHKPLGKWSKWGDISGQLVPNALYAGGMAIAAWSGVSKGRSRAEFMVMATTEAVLISTILKYTVREQRPDSNQHTSFPSGHTTSAFAFASVVGAEHGWAWGVPAYLLAGFVGWSRINDNQHYLHDVLAGATIGTSVGLGIYYSRQKRTKSARNWQVLPMSLEDGGGLIAKLNW